ncbi:MAG TPA: energy transducer TonB [Vicinamibacterales bacterium]|nr:energy transducer TonB [Vicinamibacterales bacterium]
MTDLNLGARRAMAWCRSACPPVVLALLAGACASMPSAAQCDDVFDGKPEAFAAGAYRTDSGATDPAVVRNVAPKYTSDAMRAKIQGVVELEAVVLPNGTVGDVRITKSLDSQFGLDGEAVCAVKQWRFEPGTFDGAPVPVLITLILEFRLH